MAINERADMLRFMQAKKAVKHKASLSDGKRTVVLRINPQQFSFTTEAMQSDQQTLDGFVLQDFGVKPGVINFTGFTGLDGLAEGPGSLTALEYFRPVLGKKAPLLYLTYPARGITTAIRVYMRSFSDSISIDRHLYNAYNLSMIVYPDAVLAPSLAVPPTPSPLVVGSATVFTSPSFAGREEQ